MSTVELKEPSTRLSNSTSCQVNETNNIRAWEERIVSARASYKVMNRLQQDCLDKADGPKPCNCCFPDRF